MKYTPVLLSLLILAATSALPAQSPSTPATPKPATQTPSSPAAKPAAQTAKPPVAAKPAAHRSKKGEVHLKPFSSLAFGGGMSTMGINMQASTNLNRYMNLRGTGNYFNYTASNLNINGFDVSGKVDLATAGASLDLFPFPNHGFRISPGVLFYNQNNLTAQGTLGVGNSITLAHQNIYTDTTNPMTVGGYLDVNTNKQAFMITTGWGNVIPRRRQDQVSSHLTFPFEMGLAFTGVPTLNLNLTGDACMYTTSKTTLTCDSLTDTTPGSVGVQAQNDLNTQLGIWRTDVNQHWYYKVTPIVSFGVSYSFNFKPQE